MRDDRGLDCGRRQGTVEQVALAKVAAEILQVGPLLRRFDAFTGDAWFEGVTERDDTPDNGGVVLVHADAG